MVKTGDTQNLRSGSLAKAAGVSPDTIRHYEQIGVLPKARRTPSGYRVYDPSAVERVQVVRRALRLGFTLSELAEVLKLRDAGAIPCQRVFSMATAKLAHLRAEIKRLERLERHLFAVLQEWETRMSAAPRGHKTHLLYSLTQLEEADLPTPQLKRRTL